MKQVDELIRGEISAVQSYDAVLGKIKSEEEKEKLTSLREDHVKAVEKLKQFVKAGDEKVESSGPWGAFTKTFAGGASLFGDKTAVQALRVGEEHGVNEYRVALADQGVQDDLKELIRTELLPQQEKHLSIIDGYLQ